MSRHHPRTNTLKSATLLLEARAAAFVDASRRRRAGAVVKARDDLQSAAIDFTAKLLTTGIALRDKR